jgi:hypothetical protein
VHGVLSEARMKTLMEGASDERVTPLLVTAMAANREGAVARGRQQHGKGHLEPLNKLRMVSIFLVISENSAEFKRIGSFRIAL